MDWQRYQSSVFWITFTATFLVVAVWESKRPNRSWTLPTGKRWGIHALLFLSGAIVRALILRTTPVAVALIVAESPWSVLAKAPWWLSVPLTVIALDLSKFVSHRLNHAVPWLWRLHRVHHSDPDFDLATGLRFHPLETLFVQGVDLVFIVLLAPPVSGVVIAMIVVTIINLVQHANADFPPVWEGALRPWLMTPACHRTHHSARVEDQLSNFGELVPWWDRLSGTYRARPEAGEANLEVGLIGYREESRNGFLALLGQPLEQDREAASPGTTAGAKQN
jgi:sterol desaturase/sphingolipid hydroxylase (fatty acid hydroxylase superfamily)